MKLDINKLKKLLEEGDEDKVSSFVSSINEELQSTATLRKEMDKFKDYNEIAEKASTLEKQLKEMEQAKPDTSDVDPLKHPDVMKTIQELHRKLEIESSARQADQKAREEAEKKAQITARNTEINKLLSGFEYSSSGARKIAEKIVNYDEFETDVSGVLVHKLTGKRADDYFKTEWSAQEEVSVLLKQQINGGGASGGSQTQRAPVAEWNKMSAAEKTEYRAKYGEAAYQKIKDDPNTGMARGLT